MKMPRPGRLPLHARRAVAALEEQFASDDEGAYDAALARLTQVHTELGPRHRTLLDAALARAHERVAAAAYVQQVKHALAGGAVMSVAVLPGGVELVEVASEHMDQLLLTVPSPLDTDDDHTRDLIAQARAAVLSGACPHCGAALSGGAGDQLTMEHARSCRLSARALEVARHH